MARRTKHNPEKSAWRGRSYKNGGARIQELKATSATEADQRELASLMNRNAVEVRFGELRIVCRSPEDFDRAYDLLTAQGREPERFDDRRLIICKPRST